MGVQFNASDNIALGSYYLGNWTDLFSINSTGYLSNISSVAIGNYNINVSINDTSGNTNMSWYNFNVNQLINISALNSSEGVAGQSWNMNGEWLNHTSWDGVPYAITPGLNQAIFTTGNEIYYSRPAVANGYVYVGSADNNVYQLNASNISKQIASYTTNGPIASSVAIANGYVYVGSNDNSLYQLNASDISQKIASYAAGNHMASVAAIANGYVYVGSNDNSLYQLNASDISQEIASYRASSSVNSIPAVANGYVYVGSNDGNVYQLNASNISKQIASYATGSYVTSSPAVANGYVYVGSDDGNVYQLNANNISQKIANFAIGYYVVSSPAVANGYVYIGSYDHDVYQLNASNISQRIASYTTGYYVVSSPAVANGYVYVGSDDGNVYQLNASNISKQIASYATGNYVTSSPAVANGYVYVGSQNGKVYQLNANNISAPNVPDIIPPYFTAIPANYSTTYGNGLGVQFNANDNIALGSYYLGNWTDLFSINSTGYLSNISSVAIGNYNINVSINDTSGNTNMTWYNFNVTQLGVISSPSINSCGILNTPGVTYYLNGSISANSTCIIIAADNITLNGNGYTLNGTQDPNNADYGIIASGRNNITIYNITVSGFGDYAIQNVSAGAGIFLNYTNNSALGNIGSLFPKNGFNIPVINYSILQSTYVASNSNYIGIYILSGNVNSVNYGADKSGSIGDDYGIYLANSSDNFFYQAYTDSNLKSGIYISGSSNNTFYGGTYSLNNLEHGEYVADSYNNSLGSLDTENNSQSGSLYD